MFRSLQTTAKAPLQQQSKRFWHELNGPRTWVQRYDKAITDKYPRVLDVIQGRLSRAALDTTERTALYVATYRTGVSGAKRTRQRERRKNFTSKVDALVSSWRKVEFLQRKSDTRDKVLSKGSANSLSGWSKKINEPAHQMDFKLTSAEPSIPQHIKWAPIHGTKAAV